MSSLSTVRQHPSFITDVSHQRLTLLDWNCIVLLFIFLSFPFHSSYYPFIDHPFAIPFISFVICSSTYPSVSSSLPSFLPSILSSFLHEFIYLFSQYTIFIQEHHISTSQILRRVKSRRTLKAQQRKPTQTQLSLLT